MRDFVSPLEYKPININDRNYLRLLELSGDMERAQSVSKLET
jgi:hypothetical protein